MNTIANLSCIPVNSNGFQVQGFQLCTVHVYHSLHWSDTAASKPIGTLMQCPMLQYPTQDHYIRHQAEGFCADALTVKKPNPKCNLQDKYMEAWLNEELNRQPANLCLQTKVGRGTSHQGVRIQRRKSGVASHACIYRMCTDFEVTRFDIKDSIYLCNKHDICYTVQKEVQQLNQCSAIRFSGSVCA